MSEDILHINFKHKPELFSPEKFNDRITATAYNLLFSGLTRCESNGTISLGLADSFYISKNQRLYTFQLKKSFWSNGENLSAYDIELSWKKNFINYSSNRNFFEVIKKSKLTKKDAKYIKSSWNKIQNMDPQKSIFRSR